LSADLDSLSARVAACLQDATSLVYPTDAIAEGLRQALAEISTSLVGAHSAAPLTLAGLDGASVTSLPEGLTSLAVQGAAAMVVSGRGLRHAEQMALAPEGLTPASLTWAEAVWNRFCRSCERLRSSALRGSTVPWAEMGWILDGHDGEVF